MPFLADYKCDQGHVTEHLHMGSRSNAPAMIKCETEGCHKLAERVISAVGIQAIVRGNSDFAERETERLTKRANDWDNSKQGKTAKLETVERRLRSGEVA